MDTVNNKAITEIFYDAVHHAAMCRNCYARTKAEGFILAAKNHLTRAAAVRKLLIR